MCGLLHRGLQKFIAPAGSPKRNLTDICCIAEVIARFDVCAIQETRTELTALRRVMRVLGPHWSFLVSDVTLGDPSNAERLCFVYDRRRVKPSGLVGEVVVPLEELGVAGRLDRQFARTPYAVSFAAAKKGFTLVTLHVLYGETKVEKATPGAGAREDRSLARCGGAWRQALIDVRSACLDDPQAAAVHRREPQHDLSETR